MSDIYRFTGYTPENVAKKRAEYEDFCGDVKKHIFRNDLSMAWPRILDDAFLWKQFQDEMSFAGWKVSQENRDNPYSDYEGEPDIVPYLVIEAKKK